MKICAISDTHDNHRQIRIPECDVLVVAGDFTCHRSPILANYVDFNDWLRTVPAKHKIVVAGNHDTLFELNNELARSVLTEAIYLQDSGVVIDGVNFWGSPWTPFFASWAFMKPDEMLKDYWDKIPEETNVLITHGPPQGILDTTYEYGKAPEGKHVGSFGLREKVFERGLPELRAHIFGHIHESFGATSQAPNRPNKFYNVAQSNVNNEIVNKPVIIEI